MNATEREKNLQYVKAFCDGLITETKKRHGADKIPGNRTREEQISYIIDKLEELGIIKVIRGEPAGDNQRE
jgi:hypothetical protein